MSEQQNFLEIITETTTQNTTTKEFIENFKISTRTKKALLAHGYTSLNDINGKSETEIRKCGIGNVGIYELKQYLKFEFKAKLLRPEKKKLENHEDCCKVVEHFLGKGPEIQWGREIRTASILLKSHSIDVLLRIPPPPKIYSLGYFMQDFGQEYLVKNSPIVKFSAVSSVKNDEEIIDDSELLEYTKVEKPKSLKSFLGL